MDRKKAKKIAGTTADVAAGAVGGGLRLAARILLTVLLIFITTGLLFACIFAFYVKNTLSTDLDISLDEMSVNLSSTLWYEDDGEYKELTTLASVENRIWVDYGNIPDYMKDAIISIEDHNFRTHKGVDWYRTVGAFVNMFVTMRDDFGGSTITQQLIKNLTKNDEVTVQRKLLEIFQALEFEKHYTKEEILEWYLNIVYFGEGSYGIYTAAQTYFGKDVWDLSLAECASIAGITNNPSAYDPFIYRENNKKRQEIILYEMYYDGLITHDEYQQAVDEELVFVRGEDEVYEQEIYSYYEEVVIDDVIHDLAEARGISEDTARNLVLYGGYQIYTCLDMDIQKVVDSVYEDVDNLPKPYIQSSKQLQSAFVLMDPHTGEIKALSGGVGKKTINFGLNRATGARRACGSSTKPLSVYGPAMEYGLITQNTLVNDSPNIKLTGTNWYPRNSGGESHGIITIRYALQRSLNTVAAQIMDKLTPQVSYDFMTQRLGFESLLDSPGDRDLYAPMALGEYSVGVTVREMCQAFGAFPNNGVFTYGRTYTRVTDSEGNVILSNDPVTITAFSPNTAANMCDMLYNAVQQGTGSAANFSSTAVAGKTGTSEKNFNRYFCGFTDYYVAACWTGYDMPSTMNYNNNPAIEIWRRIMEPIHHGLEYRAFPTPDVGKPTNIFGDLSKKPEPTPEPKPTPEPVTEPEDTPVSEPPVEIPEPVETEAPPAGGETEPEFPIEPEPPEQDDGQPTDEIRAEAPIQQE